MRYSHLRAFLPIPKDNLFRTSDGVRFKLVGHDPVFEEHGCSRNLRLDFGDEELNVSVTPVQEGDTLVLKVGGGKHDLTMIFDRDGICFDAPVPVHFDMLTTIRRRSADLKVDLEPVGGTWRDGKNGEAVLVATAAKVAGVTLAPRGGGNCRVEIID